MKLICFHCLHYVIIFYSPKVDCNIAKEEGTDSEHLDSPQVYLERLREKHCAA